MRGQEILNEYMDKLGITPSNEISTKMVANYHMRNREELLEMIGSDVINLSSKEMSTLINDRKSFFSKILRNPFASKKKAGEKKKDPVDRKKIYVLLPDEKNPNYKLDTCCAPIPGDEVLGFVDDDENVIVHKVSCPNAMRLKSAYGPRLVATKWGGTADRFLATISVDGIDRHGILEEITNTLSQKLSINIRGLNIAAKQEVFHCEITVQIDSVDTVAAICDALKKIKDVKFARRTS